MSELFDLVIIGAGLGGYVAAIRAAQLGMKVACLEKDSLGGTCLNVGCIPSKALLDSSELFWLAKNRFGHHGIQAGELHLDLKQMMARKSEVVKGLTDGVAFLFKKNRITSIRGSARLAGPGKVVLAGDKPRELSAPAIILATGSEAVSLPFLPFDGKQVVSSTEALCFDRVPERFLVVGGGFIGLELGSVWARLGAKVTVLEFLPRIVSQSDGEMAGLLQKSLIHQGLEFHLETAVTGARREGGRVQVMAREKGKDLSFTADRVLLAVGRRPCTSGLGLKEAGIQIEDKTGRVLVNERFQTSVPGIFAIGDLIGGPMLAHKASEEGIAVVELLAGKPGHVNYAAIPSVVYTFPELASVGPGEEELQKAGKKYRSGKFSVANSGRARCLDEAEGLVKVLADPFSDRILAVHILGPRASELIAEAVLALEFSGSAEDIARTCHAHPTLSEALAEAARAAWSAPIHA